MLGRVVKRERLTIVRSAFHDVPGTYQGHAHETVPDHERGGCLPLLCERQKLRCEFQHRRTVERHKVRDPNALEYREQRQWIFKRLTKRFLQLDLLATQRGSGGQGLDLV